MPKYAVDFFIDNKPASEFYARAGGRKSVGVRRVFNTREDATAAGLRFLSDDYRMTRRASFKISEV